MTTLATLTFESWACLRRRAVRRVIFLRPAMDFDSFLLIFLAPLVLFAMAGLLLWWGFR